MDFFNQMEVLSLKTSELLDHIHSEASTRSALVEPFIKILGYDPSNPLEVVPEFGANIDVPGTVKDKKVDYAILKDGKPIILIEVKHHENKLESGFAQLYNYFTPTDARIGILTNGITYQFYTDLERANTMDKKPFLVLDITNIQEDIIQELKKLAKSSFDIDEALVAAAELKYTRGIKSLLQEQLASPDDEFVRFFFSRLCPENNFVGKLKDDFTEKFTPKAFQAFIREEIDNLLDFASSKTVASPSEAEPGHQITDLADVSEPKIVTTEEELEAFYIVRAVLSQVTDPARIVHRDTQNYFGILLDDNNRKPICRLHGVDQLGERWLEIFDKGKNLSWQERVKLSAISDIYKHVDRIKTAITVYG